MKKVWILTDSRAGSNNQIRGIADLLNPSIYKVEEKNIEYNMLFGLPNFLRGRSLLGLTPASKAKLKGNFPDIAMAGSRRLAPVLRWLKYQSRGKCKIVQLLYPGFWGRLDFDIISVPEHDRNKISGENVIYTIGSPHRITPEKLQQTKAEWQNAFSDLPRPLTAVIIGGKIKGKGFSLENAVDFAQNIKAFQAQKGGSLLITDSHRTGKEAENKMLEILKDIPSYKYLWGSHEKNPYMGYLACADNIIVSGDSVSMCCEACGTGKPVYIYSGTNWLTPKHLRFVKSLIDSGHAASLEEGQYTFSGGKNLNPAAELVKAIENL